MFHIAKAKVLNEIATALDTIQSSQAEKWIEAILSAKKVVSCGAGRMGVMAKAFAMRLCHLGIDAYFIQDASTPRIGKGDLLIASSGSGETKTILALVEAAKQHQAQVALFTVRPSSTMASLADHIVSLSAHSKLERVTGSLQPMTTLIEQASLIFFDTLTLLLIEKMEQSLEDLRERHSVLE